MILLEFPLDDVVLGAHGLSFSLFGCLVYGKIRLKYWLQIVE